MDAMLIFYQVLDDIAWLFNIRGNDIAYCPLVLSYAIVYNNSVELFAEQPENFLKIIVNLFAENQSTRFIHMKIFIAWFQK